MSFDGNALSDAQNSKFLRLNKMTTPNILDNHLIILRENEHIL